MFHYGDGFQQKIDAPTTIIMFVVKKHTHTKKIKGGERDLGRRPIGICVLSPHYMYLINHLSNGLRSSGSPLLFIYISFSSSSFSANKNCVKTRKTDTHTERERDRNSLHSKLHKPSVPCKTFLPAHLYPLIKIYKCYFVQAKKENTKYDFITHSVSYIRAFFCNYYGGQLTMYEQRYRHLTQVSECVPSASLWWLGVHCVSLSGSI